jgi:hypothetical protein
MWKKVINVRSKGQRGERDFIKIIQRAADQVLGEGVIHYTRNIEQTRNGGADVCCDVEMYDCYSFEVKTQEKLLLNKWWQQAFRQGRDSERVPVLAYKQSRQPWLIMMPCKPYSYVVQNRYCRAIITLEMFLKIFKNELLALDEKGF